MPAATGSLILDASQEGQEPAGLHLTLDTPLAVEEGVMYHVDLA
jgi:hypothetical protein